MFADENRKMILLGNGKIWTKFHGTWKFVGNRGEIWNRGECIIASGERTPLDRMYIPVLIAPPSTLVVIPGWHRLKIHVNLMLFLLIIYLDPWPLWFANLKLYVHSPAFRILGTAILIMWTSYTRIVTSSSVSFHPVPAAMFCSSCWTVLAPMMTDGMKSFCRSQRSDTCPSVLPSERKQHCKRIKIWRRQVGKCGDAPLQLQPLSLVFRCSHCLFLRSSAAAHTRTQARDHSQ